MKSSPQVPASSDQSSNDSSENSISFSSKWFNFFGYFGLSSVLFLFTFLALLTIFYTFTPLAGLRTLGSRTQRYQGYEDPSIVILSVIIFFSGLLMLYEVFAQLNAYNFWAVLFQIESALFGLALMIVAYPLSCRTIEMIRGTRRYHGWTLAFLILAPILYVINVLVLYAYAEDALDLFLLKALIYRANALSDRIESHLTESALRHRAEYVVSPLAPFDIILDKQHYPAPVQLAESSGAQDAQADDFTRAQDQYIKDKINAAQREAENAAKEDIASENKDLDKLQQARNKMLLVYLEDEQKYHPLLVSTYHQERQMEAFSNYLQQHGASGLKPELQELDSALQRLRCCTYALSFASGLQKYWATHSLEPGQTLDQLVGYKGSDHYLGDLTVDDFVKDVRGTLKSQQSNPMSAKWWNESMKCQCLNHHSIISDGGLSFYGRADYEAAVKAEKAEKASSP